MQENTEKSTQEEKAQEKKEKAQDNSGELAGQSTRQHRKAYRRREHSITWRKACRRREYRTTEERTHKTTGDSIGEHIGDIEHEKTEDRESEHIGHMLEYMTVEHGYADNKDESESDECYYEDEEPMEEKCSLVKQASYMHQAMGKKRDVAKQKNTKLKLMLDPTDDIQESTLFKTEDAACASKILGTTDKVIEFDTLRHQFKSTKKPSKALRQAHKLLAELQTFKYKKQTLTRN